MAKILILANNDIGLYKFREELLSELIGQGHHLILSLPDGEYIKPLKMLGCEYIETSVDRRGINVLKDIALIRRYRRIMKNDRPDVILSYTIKPNIYGSMAAKHYKIPILVNITGLGTAVENPGLLQKAILFLFRISITTSRCVFFQNAENQSFFKQQKITFTNQRLIPGSGVNLNKFKSLQYPQKDTIEFVFIARIMKEKGIDEYLEAAAYIRAKYSNTRFHICGICEQDYSKILENYQNKGIIIYHGLVKDMIGIYKEIHCTVHPTFYPEGLSNVLLESCACARPIITTDRSGCREVVDDCVNGYVIRQRDSQDLIDKLEKFIGLSFEEKKRMGLAARAKVESQFDRNVVIQAYMDEINKFVI